MADPIDPPSSVIAQLRPLNDFITPYRVLGSGSGSGSGAPGRQLFNTLRCPFDGHGQHLVLTAASTSDAEQSSIV